MVQMQVSSEKDNDNENEVEQSFKWYRDFFKRGFDIFFSLIAIIILATPMMIIALWIKVDSPHEKVLFKQERIGINNVPFTILKFRSMRDDAPHQMATENFENPEMYITRDFQNSTEDQFR